MTVRLGTKLIANTSSGGTGGTNVLVDNITITKDENDIITTVAIDNKNNSSNIPAVKTWMGTLAEYEAIENKSNDVIYYITDDETLAQSANISLSNLSEEGQSKFDEKANKVDVLNKSQITNCLLEVPQNIKLELADGVLTLKAGSIVIVPNGFEEDGVTPKFDYVTVETDATGFEWVDTNIKQYMCFCNIKSNVLDGTAQDNITSSTSFPDSVGNGDRCYRTDLNELYTYRTSSGAWEKEDGLPIGLISSSGTAGEIGSIDQIFNGIGYIGSTIWVDKGVKGLIPNSKNEDGSLKNIKFTTSKVLTYTRTSTPTYTDYDICLKGTDLVSTIAKHDDVNNINLSSSGSQLSYAIIGKVSAVRGKISSFEVKQPFRAVDYNDYTKDLDTKVNKAGDTMTGDLRIHGGLTQHVVQCISNSLVSENPIADIGVGKFQVLDKAGNYLMQTGCERYADGSTMSLLRVHSPADPSNSSHIYIRAKSDGTFFTYAPTPAAGDNSTKIATTAYCVNMRCTTKATTTSSASTTRPCWVIQNYVNGTSWYRVWSDGWIEQGGTCITDDSSGTVTLLKNFTNTNYTVIGVDYYSSSTDTGGIGASLYLSNKTASNFRFSKGQDGFTWCAYGY